MRLCVTDTETTGTDDLAQVLELSVGVVDDERGPVQETIFDLLQTWLIKPTVAVHPAARGTHHITDKMLRDAPTFADFLKFWPDPFENHSNGASVFVAHNAEFDRRLIQQSLVAAEWRGTGPLPELTIDTWTCARHLWPEAPGHGNQTLRYWLDLDGKYPEMTRTLGDLNLPPHRAAPDVVVTGYLLHHMLLAHDVDELVRLTDTPVLQVNCFMPKHKGKTWAEVARVDEAYMRWMLNQGPLVEENGKKTGFDADTIHTLKFHLGLLED